MTLSTPDRPDLTCINPSQLVRINIIGTVEVNGEIYFTRKQSFNENDYDNINIIVCIKIRKYLSPIHKSYLVSKLKAYVTRLVSCVNYDQRNLTLKRGRRTS